MISAEAWIFSMHVPIRNKPNLMMHFLQLVTCQRERTRDWKSPTWLHLNIQLGIVELFIKPLSTTLIQIVCELMLHSVIFKRMTGPEDTGEVDLQTQMGNPYAAGG